MAKKKKLTNPPPAEIRLQRPSEPRRPDPPAKTAKPARAASQGPSAPPVRVIPHQKRDRPVQPQAQEPLHPNPVTAAAMARLGLREMPPNRRTLDWLVSGVHEREAWTWDHTAAWQHLREQFRKPAPAAITDTARSH